ncbi:MAG: hypothetical protein A3G91_04850 [Omnitrophica WOR_2 bacterium RIFCSPLOWO2_12_FULL_50_9]|nr:MAG: hypothetical protein A3D87_04285 [Omnitrophica WOR_2 bacterium RIFCSPHIGHO2_02_FULL_50_17]OGX41481.1 MAG: hypothetical protein A3G91_04850 [Omnitrophica WOR_2 bacterium RIFCSPLOWO2_12_FULL_50_9]
MNVKIGLMAIFFSGIAALGFAETIYLKDGRIVKGKIVNEGSYYVIVMEGKMPRRYYNDQILRIEKDEESYDYELDAVHIDPSQFEDVSPEKVNLIITLMEVNGTRQNMQTNIEQIIAQAPLERRPDFEALFDIDEIIKQLIPIYDKYYTQEELKAMIDFYRSAPGKKLVEATPQIMKEALQVSVEYFQQKAAP